MTAEVLFDMCICVYEPTHSPWDAVRYCTSGLAGERPVLRSPQERRGMAERESA